MDSAESLGHELCECPRELECCFWFPCERLIELTLAKAEEETGGRRKDSVISAPLREKSLFSPAPSRTELSEAIASSRQRKASPENEVVVFFAFSLTVDHALRFDRDPLSKLTEVMDQIFVEVTEKW